MKVAKVQAKKGQLSSHEIMWGSQLLATHKHHGMKEKLVGLIKSNEIWLLKAK